MMRIKTPINIQTLMVIILLLDRSVMCGFFVVQLCSSPEKVFIRKYCCIRNERIQFCMHEHNRIEQTFLNLFVRAQSGYNMIFNVSDHNLINI